MQNTATAASALDAADARGLLERAFENHPTHRFSIELWDKSRVEWGKPQDFQLCFHRSAALRAILASRDPAVFAEAYVNGDVDIRGDLYAAVGLGRYLRNARFSLRDKLWVATKLGVPHSRHTRREDTRDVQRHYDLSDDFFRLFLDRNMVYSCAYFERPDQDLDTAQERKLDLVCRKLNLQPGETLLDVGCGWGGLLLWAAGHYPIRARGITLSRHQAETARRRIADAGLSDRVTVEERHYSDLPEGAFDRIASVGMYEHVGIARYPSYFGALYQALRPGGLLLNHGITASRISGDHIGGEFIFRNIFPGAELDDVSHTQSVIEDTGFEVIDVQALRPHYALTLLAWMRRFQAHRSEAARLVPQRLLRAWDLYFPGCARAFEENQIGVYQVLCAKPDADGRADVPLTREALLS